MLGFRQLSQKYTHFAVKALVNTINIFGVQPQLTVTKAKKFNTLIGLLFTMLLFVAILILVLFELNELILHEKPLIISSERELDQNKEYLLKQKNFTMSFGILNQDFIAIDEIERYFTFQVKFCRTNRTAEQENGQQQLIKNCIILDTVPCEANFYSQEVLIFFEKVNISNYRCINPTQFDLYNISLQGSNFQWDMSYISIELLPCQNNAKCHSNTLIDNLLQQAYYSYFVPDALVQWENSKNLTKSILRNDYSQIYKKQSQIIKLQYQIIENEIDTTYAFQNYQHFEYLKVFDSREQINLSLSDKLIYQEITLNPKILKNFVSYIKLAAFASKLGGYAYFLILLIKFIIYPINKILYIMELTNKIFRLKIVQDDLNVYQQENDNVIIKSAYFQNLESPNSYNWANVNENLLNQNQRITNFLQKVKTSISLTWTQLVSLILGCSTVKKEQILKLEKKINRKMDIVYIIQKLVEIDKLKFILLNEDQLNLFNSLQKPLLFVDEKSKREQRQFFEEDSKKVKLEKGFKSYVNLQDKQQKCATDLKLLSLLDNDLIYLFDKLYHELTFKSFFQDIVLRESKTFNIKKNSKESSPEQQIITTKHVKLQTNADQ